MTLSRSVPKLHTKSVFYVGKNSAASGGNIISDGGAEITARGVCWATHSNPRIDDDYTIDGNGTGSFESDLNKLIKGQPVRVYLNPQDKTYQKARLEKISMTPGDDLGRFNVRIKFDSPPKDITEGVRVDFRIIVESRKNAIAVPIEFVRKEKGRYYVVVIQGEENVEREVKLGLADDHIYEVLDGLKKGEKVILKIESDK